MLRTIDEKQGIGVYSQNLMDHMLRMDQDNEYVLFYRNPDFLGRYAEHAHVTEQLVTAPNKLLWDQFRIPLAARRAKCDLVFHTKFTVPLLSGIPSVMVLHGSAWYVDEQSYKPLDIKYIKAVLPMYIRKSAKVISVSDRARFDMEEYAGADPTKFQTVYNAPDDRFFERFDEARLQEVREKYDLPERFLLNVGSLSTAKNVKNLLLAFAMIKDEVPQKLLIAGRLRVGASEELAPIETHQLEDYLCMPGWISQEDMPAVLQLADLFVLPSWYESCSVALLEAMAAGCAVVTAGTGGTPELTGDAAILVDPAAPEDIANGIRRALTDDNLRRQMCDGSVQQGKLFGWERCARETLAVLNAVGGRAR